MMILTITFNCLVTPKTYQKNLTKKYKQMGQQNYYSDFSIINNNNKYHDTFLATTKIIKKNKQNTLKKQSIHNKIETTKQKKISCNNKYIKNILFQLVV